MAKAEQPVPSFVDASRAPFIYARFIPLTFIEYVLLRLLYSPAFRFIVQKRLQLFLTNNILLLTHFPWNYVKLSRRIADENRTIAQFLKRERLPSISLS